MIRLAIIGSGDLARQITYHVEADRKFRVVGYFDDFKVSGSKVLDTEILGQIDNVFQVYRDGIFDELLIAIGYEHMSFRKQVYDRLSPFIPFATFIHSSCIIDPTSVISKGVVIYPGTIIDQNVRVSENVLINLGCCLSHDSEIGAHCFLSPRVSIAGFVRVGDTCVLGINCTLIDNISVVAETQIGAAGVAIKNIEKAGVYVGNPLKLLKHKHDTI